MTMSHPLRYLAPVCALAVAALPHVAAHAQAYPSKPIRMLLPQTPGSGVDLILRRASEELQPRLGQPILVENRAGGNGVVAADGCAKANPDGYTLCTLNNDALAINPHIFSKLPYNAETDFRAVTSLYYILGGLFTKVSLPVNTAQELRALAVAKPGALNWGILGPGTITDMSRMWLADNWKTTFTGIPYKGGPEIMNAVSSGEIDATWQGVYVGLGLIKANKVKLLAVSGSRRLPAFPNVPTLQELGDNGLPSASAWWGVLGPAALPDAVVSRLNSEFTRLFAEPKFVEFLDSLVTEARTSTPEGFAAQIRSDRERLGQIIRKYNIPRQ
jgi:tripartite-type tricarboxylate transporter receptor subunit TctC